jgi:hypothetical protein
VPIDHLDAAAGEHRGAHLVLRLVRHLRGRLARLRPRPVPQLGYPSFDQPGLAVGGVVPPDPISESIDAAERHVERS